MQTKIAANHRRRSTFSCRKNFAANALPINVSEALAGAASETSTCDSVSSNVKKLSAIQSTPSRNIGLETTAVIATDKIVAQVNKGPAVCPFMRSAPEYLQSTDQCPLLDAARARSAMAHSLQTPPHKQSEQCRASDRSRFARAARNVRAAQPQHTQMPSREEQT